MIRILAVTDSMKLLKNISIQELERLKVKWYWADFSTPDEHETGLLGSYFNFHHLSIEDCMHTLERPKLDYYDKYNFLVLHALNQRTLSAEELDVFIGANYIVTFHQMKLQEVDDTWNKVCTSDKIWDQGHNYTAYFILDKIVDQYFPAVHNIEDQLDELEAKSKGSSSHVFINRLFELRSDMLKLRRIVNSMRDLLYRILNSSHLEGFKDNRLYFTDIYDHLLKLTEMIESNREITEDMRDSYLSINSHRMNTIMMVLTVITTIFIPLTFIVGIYGMNFKHMPELEWRYGYYAVLIVMASIAAIMFWWIKKKGWFDMYK